WRKPSNGMKGVPVWSHDGILCTGETYKNAVKMTFAKGASLPDPAGLFNSSLEGATRRAIDFHEGDEIDEQALAALIRAAAALTARRSSTSRNWGGAGGGTGGFLPARTPRRGREEPRGSRRWARKAHSRCFRFRRIHSPVTSSIAHRNSGHVFHSRSGGRGEL